MVSKPASTLLRPAVAMIELIFALVIMGIVLMSAPQLIATAKQGTLTSIQQEAIAMGASHITLILSRYWDETNTPVGLPVTILQTTSDTNALNQVGLEPATAIADPRRGLRAGTPQSGFTRSYTTSVAAPFQNATAANALGREIANDGNLNDDIDDYANSVATLRQSGVLGGDNYVDTQMTMNTNVFYITDAPTNVGNYNSANNTFTYNLNNPNPVANINRSTHIKYINVNLLTGANAQGSIDSNITLEAFSCNIGRQMFDTKDTI